MNRATPTLISRLAVLASIAAFVGLVAAPAVPAAERTPSVRITAISGPTSATPGEAVSVAYRVSRRRAGSRTGALRFFLSRSRTSTRAAIPLGGRVSLSKLRRRRSLAGRRRVTVPPATGSGSYRLLACLERVRPAACRHAARSISIRGAGSSDVPAQGQQPTHGPGLHDPGPQPQPSPGPIPGDFTGSANPVSVDATPDAGRTARRRIGPAGGTLTATGANGVVYRLTVPADALLSEAEISLTPVASIDGLPLSGGLVAAAQLGPEGLRFARPVTLELENLPAVPPAEETGFGYHADGRDFHLHAPRVDPTRTAFSLMHFSGYGIARGTAAERRAQLARDTTDAEDRLTQRASEVIQRARERALRGEPGGDLVDDLAPIWTAYHDQVIAPLTTAARTDDRLMLHAIHKWAAWERQMQLLGYEGLREEREARNADVQDAIRNAIHASYDRCVHEHRLEEVEQLLSLHRTAALWGIEVGATLDAQLMACARFELDFETRLAQEDRGDGAQVWRGHLRVHDMVLQLDPDSRFHVRGSKDVEYLSFDVEPPSEAAGCVEDDNGDFGTLSPLQVTGLAMELNTYEQPDGSYEPPQTDVTDISLFLVPFLTREYVYYSDCGGSTGEGGDQSWASNTWFDLHDPELTDEGYRLTDWQRPTVGGLWARKVYQRQTHVDGYRTTEQTTIEIWHRPLG